MWMEILGLKKKSKQTLNKSNENIMLTVWQFQSKKNPQILTHTKNVILFMLLYDVTEYFTSLIILNGFIYLSRILSLK